MIVLPVINVLLVVALVAETLYFNFLTKRKLEKRSDTILDMMSDTLSCINRVSDRVTKLDNNICGVAELHDKFVDYIEENLKPRVTALELSRINKPTKEEKRGRPKKK